MVKKLLFNLHRFKKGKTVSIFVIHECNLDCSYCSAQFIKGRFPAISTVLYAQTWMDILAKDKDIKIVEISGGEPLMYPYIAQLLVLLSKKYYVRVYSNLMVKRNLKRFERAEDCIFEWDITTVANGIYIYHLATGSGTVAGRLIVR